MPGSGIPLALGTEQVSDIEGVTGTESVIGIENLFFYLIKIIGHGYIIRI